MSRGAVRIIGGCWRGSRVAVDAGRGVRPSADRVRETVFNWLQATLPGARCLDLFAGSGVLGLEAASRGAARVDLVERDAVLARAIEDTHARLAAGTGDASHGRPGEVHVHAADVLAWLGRGTATRYDVVFVDPPFDAALLPGTLRLLERGWLADDARVYVEQAAGGAAPGDAWQTLRRGHTREVDYALLTPNR